MQSCQPVEGAGQGRAKIPAHVYENVNERNIENLQPEIECLSVGNVYK